MDLDDKILLQVRTNNLEKYDVDFIIAQLCVLNNKPFDLMKEKVDDMVEKGLIVPSVQDNTRSTIKVDNVPKSPYNQTNEEIAYEILSKKDKRSKRKKGRLTGKIQGTSKGYAFLVVENDPDQQDVYIAERNLRGALHGDTAVVEIINSNNGRREEGKVVQVLERANDSIVGKINFTKKYALVTPDDVKFGTDIFVPLNKTLNAHNGDKVVVAIDRYYPTKKTPDGRVVEVLGAPNKIETEVLALVRSYHLYETFPTKVAEAAKNVPDSIDKSKYPSRLDYTDEMTFTIDGEDTRDIDDAISLTINEKGNYVLGVHIADVGEYVGRNSVIDREAFKRGTSVYFPNLVLPMLPRELSNGICSLNEKVDRLTLSVFIEYDKNSFERVDYKITESIINSKKRYTYTEIQKIFDGDETTIEKNSKFVPMINNMRVLASKLAEQRHKRGAIEFDIPEVQVNLNALGDVLEVFPRENNESHRLIESFMVAANEAIAEHFLKLKVPFVYRIHEIPDGEKMKSFIEFINGLGIEAKVANVDKVKPEEVQTIIESLPEDKKYVVNRIALRSMRKAKYSPECLGHFGLASTYYCHFTSPIRRYPDLTIHRIIKESLRGKLNASEIANLKQFVLSSSMQSSEREVNAEKIERDVDDLYRVLYMTHHVGEDFEGTVSGVTEFGIFVELDNTVEGLVKIEDLPADRYTFDDKMYRLSGNANSYTIGDKVKVKTLRADVLTREVDFMII